MKCDVPQKAVRWLAPLLAWMLVLPGISAAVSGDARAPSPGGNRPAVGTDIKAGPHGVARPKIGLVLSGGGARGLAHVGVLKELEAARPVVDEDFAEPLLKLSPRQCHPK